MSDIDVIDLDEIVPLDSGDPLASAQAFLEVLKLVDGINSGLDADLLRGVTPAATGLALLPTATAGAARTVLGLVAVAASGSATDLTTGTLPDARQSANVAMKNTSATFSGFLASTSSVNVFRDGSDAVTSGAYIAIANSVVDKYWINQLSASNHLDWHYYDGAINTLLVRLKNDGAFILGHDHASAGRFRLATHTTSAGGIALGPDCPVFRAAAGVIGIGDGTTAISTATTVGAAGGASAPPATPTGYLRLSINGTVRKIAYYADA